MTNNMKKMLAGQQRLSETINAIVVRFVDAHPTLFNIFLWLLGVGIMVEIFLFA